MMLSPWLNGYWVFLYYYAQAVVGDPRYPEDEVANVFRLRGEMEMWGSNAAGFITYGMVFYPAGRLCHSSLTICVKIGTGWLATSNMPRRFSRILAAPLLEGSLHC